MITISRSRYEAFIFDMDGTMVDNMMVHHRAWQQKLEEMGMKMNLEEVMEKVHGINEEILERLFGNQLTLEERKRHAFEKEKRYRTIYKDALRLIDGLPTLMDHAKALNLMMAVGSAAPPENVDFVLDNLKIRSYFEVVLHSGDVEKGKPNPEIYLKIMEHMKVKSSNTLVFEDSVVGAQAAENAGCDVLIVTTTHKPDEFAALKNVIGFLNDFTVVKIDV